MASPRINTTNARDTSDGIFRMSAARSFAPTNTRMSASPNLRYRKRAAASARAAATSGSAGSRRPVGALGTALLKAGDAAAAALGDGYTAAEREIAARTGSARRALLDELLEPPPGDAAAAARIIRRAGHFGLASGDAYRVLVVRIGRELEDEGLAEHVDQESRLRRLVAPSHAAAGVRRSSGHGSGTRCTVWRCTRAAR